MNCIYHLIYLSKATDSLAYSDVQQIVTKAIQNNVREGLTGLLVYHEGWFLQFIEGDEIAVREAMARIIRDTRHRHLHVLAEISSAERYFENTPAAFYDGDLDVVHGNPLAKEIFELALGPSRDDKSALLQMLKKFYDSSKEVVGKNR